MVILISDYDIEHKSAEHLLRLRIRQFQSAHNTESLFIRISTMKPKIIMRNSAQSLHVKLGITVPVKSPRKKMRTSILFYKKTFRHIYSACLGELKK